MLGTYESDYYFLASTTFFIRITVCQQYVPGARKLFFFFMLLYLFIYFYFIFVFYFLFGKVDGDENKGGMLCVEKKYTGR